MNNNKNRAAGPPDELAARLQEALDQLHRDVLKVEVWAGALTGFAKPIPTYEPSEKYLLKGGDQAATGAPATSQQEPARGDA